MTDIIYATELYTMPGDIYCGSCGQLAVMDRLDPGWHKLDGPLAIGACGTYSCGMAGVKFYYPIPKKRPYVLLEKPPAESPVPQRLPLPRESSPKNIKK